MKINWARTLGVPFTVAFILHFLIAFNILADWIGAEGFYAHYAIVAWLILLYPLSMVGASVIVAIGVRENRAGHFFLALFVAVWINFLFFALLSMHGERQNEKAIEQMYIDNPQSRPLWDSQRPLSIMKTTFVVDDQSSPIDVVVHAMSGVLSSGESVVEIKGDVYPPDSKAWGEGILYSTGERSDGGRTVFTATVDFVPEDNWYSAIVIVRGVNGEFTSSHIRKR